MKIAMIGHKRIPSRQGGVEVVVEQLAIRMAAQGHCVEVYNRKERVLKNNELLRAYKGVRIIEIPTFRSSTLNAFVYSVLATLRALFGKYDVIHYHAEGPCGMLWLPHLLGIRTVATIHGLDWQRSKWGGFASKYLRYGEKIAAKYANQVIVLSHNIKQYFLDTYQRDVVYIPNGIEIPEHKESQLIIQQFGLEKDGYILFLARIVPEKGLHYLLEAYGGLSTDKKLVIAGDLKEGGEYINRILAMGKQDDRVIFVGHASGQLLAELFSNCFLYVLPSDVEGMALSLLEALSYQAVCLVSDIAENTEIVGTHMPVFQHSDVQSLRDMLQTLLQDGIESYRNALFYDQLFKEYDWHEIVQQTLRLYQRS